MAEYVCGRRDYFWLLVGFIFVLVSSHCYLVRSTILSLMWKPFIVLWFTNPPGLKPSSALSVISPKVFLHSKATYPFSSHLFQWLLIYLNSLDVLNGFDNTDCGVQWNIKFEQIVSSEFQPQSIESFAPSFVSPFSKMVISLCTV